MARKRYCLPDPVAALTDEILLREIPVGSRVIDLGCGEGRLLKLLQNENQCSVLGIELDEESFHGALENGVSVLRADLDEGLNEVPDNAFDFAVLSQTLQQVRNPLDLLNEILRVASKVIVIVPNFGHWKVRIQVLLQGRAPVTDELPYEWYNSPNLHFMSMYDFRDLTREGNFRIIKELPLIGGKSAPKIFAANLRAQNVLYVLEKNSSGSS